MSIDSLLSSGGAFTNPIKDLLGNQPTYILGLKSAIELGSPSFYIPGLDDPLDLTQLIPQIPGTPDPQVEQFVNSLESLAGSYDGLIKHTDQQTSPDVDPTSDSPSMTQILSLNGAQEKDGQCSNVQLLLGLILRKDELYQEWLFFLGNLQTQINSIDSSIIDDLKNQLEQEVLDEKDAFRAGVVDVARKAAKYVLQSAFGDNCAKKILDQTQSQELKIEQKLYEESQSILP